MIELIITLLIGLAGGVAVGTQAPIAGSMSQRVGGAASSVIVHLGGLIASLIYLAVQKDENISQWRELPWYMLGCGTFGLVLYLSITHTMPKLGAAASISLIIVDQLLAGVVIDYLGAFGTVPKDIDIIRILGIALLLAGVALIIR